MNGERPADAGVRGVGIRPTNGIGPSPDKDKNGKASETVPAEIKDQKPPANERHAASGRRLSSSELQAKAKDANFDEVQKVRAKFRATGAKPFWGDPTRPLTPISGSLERLEFDEGTVANWTSKLDRHRMLLLRCPDDEVLYFAAHAISDAPQFHSYQVRELTFGNLAKFETDVSFEYLCDSRIGEHHKMNLILVFAYSADSEFFLQSLPESPDQISFAHRLLDDSRKIVVVTTPSRLQTAGFKKPTDEWVVSVNFLSCRLRQRFPGAWQTLEHNLEQQFRKGLWGKEDEEEFCQRVNERLQDGSLLVEVERRGNPPDALHANRPTLSEEMLGDDKPLENTVAFVATYFKRLPADDFQRVLLKLLGERTLEINIVSSSPGPETTRLKLLRQIWIERRQTILKSCKLRLNKAKLIEFDQAEVCDVLEEEFESQFVFLFDDLCRIVETTGLLFDQKNNVSEAVMRLITRRIRNNLQGYGEEFLPALVVGADESPKLTEATPENMRAVLSRLPDSRRHHVLNRMASLFNLLLTHESGAAVDRAMKLLLDMGCHSEVLQLLGRVGHPAYREKRVSVVKRILNEGNNELREAVYQLLFRWALQGGSASAALLKNIYSWCDGGNTPSYGDAMQFLVHLCEWAVMEGGPSEGHPLASALTVADAETTSALTKWLFSLEAGPEQWQTPEWKVSTAMLTFLWIMPRPLSNDFLVNNRFLCACVQITWSLAFEDALMQRLADLQHDEVRRDSFRALAVMDCAVAMAGTPGAIGDPSPLRSLAEAVVAMERKTRASILAHCDAVIQSLNECISVASEVTTHFAEGRESVMATNGMKKRWRTIGDGLKEFRSRIRQSSLLTKSARGGN